MDYEDMLSAAEEEGLLVKEKPLTDSDGIIKGRRVAIRRTIKTYKKKSEVLAEEICHKKYTVGNILKYSNENNRKQEMVARTAAYRMKITFDQLISASERGIRSRWELAEYLDCTEEFLQDAIERYHEKYGTGLKYNGYYICFEPCFAIVKLI